MSKPTGRALSPLSASESTICPETGSAGRRAWGLDTQIDPNSCGGCGTVCSGTCVSGSCSALSYVSCKAILDAGKSVGNGLYSIDPNGGSPTDAFQTYCDMTTDGGGWSLILNRIVDSDNSGEPDLNAALGTFDNGRGTNWHFNIDLFWNISSSFVWADKENNNCSGCPISSYDSAVRLPKPAYGAWSVACSGTSSPITVTKLFGPSANTTGTAYSCAATLGWGSCRGKVCHYGVHSDSTSNDGTWSYNGWNELHFPSAYSSYKSYGDVNNPPSAWCRSCGGGLAASYNSSSSCCQASSYNARSRWTLWAK